MSGRKQHQVWLCFTRDSSCRTNIKGKCKGCGEVVQGLVGRLEKHASCCRRLAALGLFGADHFASPSASHSQSQSPPEQGSRDENGCKSIFAIFCTVCTFCTFCTALSSQKRTFLFFFKLGAGLQLMLLPGWQEVLKGLFIGILCD